MNRVERFFKTSPFLSSSRLVCPFSAPAIIFFNIILSMIFAFPHLTISSINCSSLNMSTITSAHHKLKIYGITKLKSDIIFLSDIRLGSKCVGGNGLAFLEKTFQINPYSSYSFLSNSSSSSRGVGILFKKNLNFSVAAEARDEDENLLAVRLALSGTEVIFISAYGPNNVDKKFFEKISQFLLEAPNVPVIMGGDWNCTLSCNPANSNPDICEMVNLPNITHSKQIKALCDRFSLSDPFRCFYPTRKDFSYTPRSALQKNRSRLDFFLISDCLLPFATDCYICPSLQNYLFDHKAVTLSFLPKESKNKKPSIANYILNDPLSEFVSSLAAIECYIHHIPPTALPASRAVLLLRVGTAKSLLRTIGADSDVLIPGARTEADELIRAGRIGQIKLIIDDFNLTRLQSLALDIEDDLFLEYLLNCIRNELVSYQTFISKTFNSSKNALIKQLQ